MRKDNPLVSIIMSEYNTDKELLKKSIDSILKQTYKNIEIVLVDDCGKNDVSRIIDSFNDNRIILLKNDKNLGLVYSLNRAIKNSNGKYIARMDTDDWSFPDRIEKQVDFMENNKAYAIISGNAIRYNEKEEFGRTYGEGEITKRDLLRGNPIIHPTVMARRNVFIKAGGYPEFKRCEDYAMWIEVVSLGYKIYIMDDILIKYHLSLDDYKKRGIKTRIGFFQIMKNQYKKLNPNIIDIIRCYLKNIIAGILPHKLIFKYHRYKNRYR